jgi:HlyD family secretion protein
VLVVAGCGSKPASPPTAQVQRGAVATEVSASGSLSAVTSQNVQFLNTAKVIELDVKVGDTVKPGQILAKQDPFTFTVALNQARATLAQQQATLALDINNVNVPNARATLDASVRVLNATRHNVETKDALDANATHDSRRSLEFAAYQIRQAKRAYRDCLLTPVTPTAMSMPTAALTGALSSVTAQMETQQQAKARCASQKAAISTAIGTYLQAKASYEQAQHTEDVDHTQGVISIRQAQATVVTNQGSLDSARTDRPSMIAAQRAMVANQIAAVATAQHNVDNTILYAPVGGQVSAITGTVGEYQTGSSSATTALAPGTEAAIPGVGAAATSDQSGNASSGISATRPGGGAFIVLNNVNTFQVVVPFEESDAAKVQPNQDVQVTFDAIPDLELPGKVLSIAPNGVNISGVTNYYATILLTKSDPRLKAGQTAEASVVTNSLDNVLVVPNSAVIKQGGNSYVNVLGPNGQPTRKQFTPGAVGDDNTQVLGGLTEGQQILVPQVGPGSGSTTGGSGGTRGTGGSGGSGAGGR